MSAEGETPPLRAPEDVTCEHGTAMDVHCCGCHSGFLFDIQTCTCGGDMSTSKDDGAYLWERCYSCGHRLAFASDSCPQCGEYFDNRKDPKRWPEKCQCERCTKARYGRV